MIFYKKTNDFGNVWVFNMTYFFIVFILKRKGIICIFIQTYRLLLINTKKDKKASDFDAFKIR
ncbi:hypothetical protein COL81_05135 [Bacillus toyonensis]|nr:hypothetical protein COL81_05135 [Bacillus toyonensis]